MKGVTGDARVSCHRFASDPPRVIRDEIGGRNAYLPRPFSVAGHGETHHHGRSDRISPAEEGHAPRARDSRRDRRDRLPLRAGRGGGHPRALPRRGRATDLAVRDLQGDRGQDPKEDEAHRHDLHERHRGGDGPRSGPAAQDGPGDGQPDDRHAELRRPHALRRLRQLRRDGPVPREDDAGSEHQTGDRGVRRRIHPAGEEAHRGRAREGTRSLPAGDGRGRRDPRDAGESAPHAEPAAFDRDLRRRGHGADAAFR